jgi:predicted dehydrogenase
LESGTWKFHLDNWKKSRRGPGRFYDPSDDAAKEVSEKYQLARFLDEDSLIDTCDAIDIVALQISILNLPECVRKGKHVFVEKPLANTMDEAHRLVKLAQESNIKLQVGHVESSILHSCPEGTELNPMFIEVHRLAQFNPRGTEVVYFSTS